MDFKIAVLHADTLAAIGLRQILQEIMPSASVDIFCHMDELEDAGADGYYHYFAATDILLANIAFFSARRVKTIALSPVPGEAIAGYNTICTTQSEASLLKDILTLEQHAHGGGRNLPPGVACANHGGGRKALTPRQAQILALVAKGYINKEIADRLNISLATVVSHRQNIMHQLGVRSVSALAIYAVTHRLVTPGEVLTA